MDNEKELDNFLQEIGVTDVTPVEEKKDLTMVKFGDTEVAVDDEDAMLAAVFTSALEDKTHSDELYNYYVSRIEMDRDRSDSVREGLAKAVELRTNSTSNLIKLLELRNKQKMKAVQGNNLINLNLSPRETGIDMKNLTNEILNSPS